MLLAVPQKGDRKMSKNSDKVVQQILSRIGSDVKFKYPGTEGSKSGVISDRVVVPSRNAPGSVPYWDVVDKIEFEGEKHPTWMRIGYYRKPKDKLVWGSQTTITEPISVWKNIMIEAANNKAWFRELLKDVVKGLKKPL
jgi:hypothetical protein